MNHPPTQQHNTMPPNCTSASQRILYFPKSAKSLPLSQFHQQQCHHHKNPTNSHLPPPSHTTTIASYNTLSPAVLYRSMYPYSSKKALKWKYRKQQLHQEIAEVHPDIMCCQEVSFIDQWRNSDVLKRHYSQFHYVLGGNQHGSLVMHNDNFKCLHHEKVFFSKVFQEDEHAEEEAFKLDSNVAQIVVLEEAQNGGGKLQERTTSVSPPSASESQSQSEHSSSSPSQPQPKRGLIICNTHLYWNYRTPYIRLRQLSHLLTLALQLQSKFGRHFQIICCGDLNFTPDTADFKYFFGYEWNQEDYDRLVNSSLNQEKRKQWIREHRNNLSPEFKLPHISSVYEDYRKHFPYEGTDEEGMENTTLWVDQHPVYTTFAQYHGALDYILNVTPSEEGSQPWLQPVGFMKLLDEKHLGEGIPNDEISSDHLMIMGVFEEIVRS